MTKLADQGLFVVVGGLLRLLVTARKRRKVLHAMEEDHLQWKEVEEANTEKGVGRVGD